MKANDTCEYLEWDSDFFNRKIARINASHLSSDMMKSVMTQCRNHGIECIYFLVDAADCISTKTAEENKFHLVDIRIELERKIEGTVPQDAIEGSLRPCNQDDIPDLRAIARVSHRDSRFYHDGNFPHQICDAFYEKWIEKSCNGYANAVLIAESQGQPVGYVSCNLGLPGEGSIELLAVRPDFQRKGLGKLLTNGAIRWLAEHGVFRATVVTQGRNCIAQRLYQRCGFMTKSMHIWYHWWRHSLVL